MKNKRLTEKLIQQYNFDEYVIKTLYNYCNNIDKVSTSYILNVAECWKRHNILKKKDLEMYYKKIRRINNVENKISKLLKRKTTQYEWYYIEKWLFKSKVKEEDIIKIIKEQIEIRIDFDNVDKLINN